MQRKFRFKLTFARGEEREEFPYIEFKTIRPGQKEIEIRSCAPSLPFQLTLVVNRSGGSGQISMKFAYVGHEIRKIYKAHRACKLLFAGGTLDLTDLDSEQKFATLGGVRNTSRESDADAYLDRFIEALHEVALGFNETITWSSVRTRDDSIHLQHLREIVRTGQLSLPVDELTVSMKPLPGINAEEMLAQGGFLRIEQINEVPEFATIFGKIFDVGPYTLLINARKVEFCAPSNGSDDRAARITSAGPAVFTFEKFLPK